MINEAVGRIGSSLFFPLRPSVPTLASLTLLFFFSFLAAAGRGHELEDVFVSDIHKYTAKMDWTGGKTPKSDSSAGIEEKKKGGGGGFWAGLRS